MENKQEKELNGWGFKSDKGKRTVLYTILFAMMSAISYLYYRNITLSDRLIKMQGDLYKEMINEIKVQVEPAVTKVTESAFLLDSAVQNLQKDTIQTPKGGKL